MNKAILMIILMCWQPFLFAAHSIADKHQELSRLNREINQLQQTVGRDHQKHTSLEQELQSTDLLLNTILRDVNALNRKIDREKARLQTLQSSHQAATDQLLKQKESLSKQIQSIYRLNQVHSLKILLNQEDPSQITRLLAYNRYIGKARITLMEDIKKTLADIDFHLKPLLEQQTKLKRLLVQKEKQRAQQVAAQEKRKSLLKTLQHSIETKQQKMQTLQANQKALQAVIQQLHKKSATSLSDALFQTQRGKLEWPASGRLVLHNKSTLLIHAPAGTPVKAISEGKVIFANWLRGFGLLIIINHSPHYLSLYGRNDALYAKAGDYVSKGDVIATTGNSGGFTQPGLYFEIRKNGIPVNPQGWFREG